MLTRSSQASVKVLKSGKTYKVAEVVGINMRRDLCVLRVDDTSTAPLMNSADKPAVGDEVYVAGNPKGLEGSFSRGIVSGIRTDAGLIQMDAPISPGSSGGPVVNGRAEVIGVAVSSVVGGQNLNFAIPIEYLGSLRLNFRVPVVVAGAFSIKDRDKDKLKDLVRSVTVKEAAYGYDERSDRFYQRPAQLAEQSKYDVDGNKVELSFFDSGELLATMIHTFDEEGFVTHWVQINGNGAQKESDVSREESMSDKLEKRMFSGTEETQISKSTYDRNGNEIEATLNSATHDRWVYSYNRNGFMTEKKSYKNDQLERISRYTYETDEHGNWIKQYETNYSTKYPESGFIPAFTTYREIIYY